jgi:16S rRNA (cytosine1402-N4)-methyltransferase
MEKFSAHLPVLLEEVIGQLAVVGDGVYVDATFGRGGHSRGILQRLGPGGRLMAMDRDPRAVMAGRELEREDVRFSIEQETFGHLRDFADRHGATGRVSGILLDLGVSSPQLDDAERGFSFQADGPLDMRMNPADQPSAASWLAAAPEREITRVLRQFGEEPAAARIARAVCREREVVPITTTKQLSDLVEGAVGRATPGRKHPATRVFQAIRIHINRELEELEAVLTQALTVLRPAGRLCVISFHSLEDRLVKRFLRDRSRVDPRFARMPRVPASARPVLRLPSPPIHAGAEETKRNPRARSAVLRVAELLA